MTTASRHVKKTASKQAANKKPAKKSTGTKTAAAPIEVSLPELVTLNNALNQALELGDSDYSTLIGGSKRAGERLLDRLGTALGASRKGT